MTDFKELEKIKKIYGERFMKLCREFFPTILEKEGVLLEVLTSKFGANCKNLYEDIINSENEYEFKKYIFSKIDVENDMRIIKNKTAYELLDEAGYTLYECNSEEEVQAFKKYYAKDEELCTFHGGRLNRCVVFFAVKKDVDNIRRENFSKPRREDEYGTSVLGIQFDKRGQCTVSIKNRYNHRVNNPDATYGNDLEKIIPGLTNSFKELLVQRNLKLDTSNIEILEMPGYVMASDGKYYKYNIEIDGIYYCPGNIVIDFGNVVKIENPEKQLLIENFVLDMQNKTLKTYSEIKILDEMYEAKGNMEFFKEDEDYWNGKLMEAADTFSIMHSSIEKIDIKNDDEEKNGTKTITLKCEFQEYPIVIKIDKENNIIYYKNENLRIVPDKFLDNNIKMKKIELSNAEKIGDKFLESNEFLEEVELSNAKEIGWNFLYDNRMLKKIELPNAERIGENFLYSNDGVKVIKFINTKDIAELDKQNCVTTAEIKDFGRLYIGEFFQEKEETR